MSRPSTVQDLKPTEIAFAIAIAQLGFGHFEFVQIRRGEVDLDPGPTTVRDVKFAAAGNTARPADPGTALRPQIAEFFEYVRDVDTGEIRRLEVRHGLPFSMEVELARAKRERDVADGGCRG